MSSPARLLDETASAGLPVPAGAILLDEFYQILLESGVATLQTGRLEIREPAQLYDTLYNGIRFPRLDYRVTVRPLYSAAGAAVDAGDSWPPPAVDFTAIAELTHTLTGLWQAALSWEQQNPAAPILRRDVIVMKAVTTHTSGEAVSRLDENSDSIRYQEGAATGTLRLARLNSWQRPDTDLPLFGQRLQQLLRGVRRTVGKGNWQIQWADDGRICWLVKIRPAEA